MVVGLVADCGAHGVERGQALLLLVALHEEPVVTIIPSLGIKQRQLSSSQGIDHRRQGEVAPNNLSILPFAPKRSIKNDSTPATDRLADDLIATRPRPQGPREHRFDLNDHEIPVDADPEGVGPAR